MGRHIKVDWEVHVLKCDGDALKIDKKALKGDENVFKREGKGAMWKC